MNKNAAKIVVEKPARRNGIVVAMLNRGGDGKHRNKNEKRADMKLRRAMSSEW